MKVLAVTGGKGGTGKTFISVNLAVYFAKRGMKVLLLDCDVENPNTFILLGGNPDRIEGKSIDVYQFIPKFDTEKCTKCGECSRVCRPHAIFQIKDNYPILMDHLCSGCKLCYRICPTDAIQASNKKIGKVYITESKTFGGGTVKSIVGELKVGEVRAVKVIEKVFAIAAEINESEKYDIIIADTAPGAHCDVEYVIKNSKFALCITEPTPFGKHDLERIFMLAELLNKKTYTVINRSEGGESDSEIIELARKYNSEVIARIPNDTTVIESYARGIPFLEYKSAIKNENILRELENLGKTVLKYLDSAQE